MTTALKEAGAALYGAAWEARRRAYARGWRTPLRAPCRVVSIGNLTVGGTGKTTLTLHLARRALERGIEVAVVGRRYRPGPAGRGDEELMYRAALGPDRTRVGARKRDLAVAAAARARLVLVDDGFSHWSLARDVDLVLIDVGDPWGGGRLLPAGRLREPRRALQRAHGVILSRLAPDQDFGALEEEIRRYAPAARWAAGRHRIRAVESLDGSPHAARGRVHVVTATGNPAAVAASAREAGFEVLQLAHYRDHHWFTEAEARRERARAEAAGATILVTAKDAVRWPLDDPGVAVLQVEWQWLAGGEAIEALVFDGDPS